jgi:hypothetical protein
VTPFIKPEVMYKKTIIPALYIAIGAVLVSGLVAIPMLEEVEARSGKRNGRGGGCINT